MGRRSILFPLQDAAQNFGMAEIDFACGCNKRRGATSHHPPKGAEFVRMTGEFGSIAPAKFGKPRRLVAIPFAQLARRREFARPGSNFQFRFG